MEKGLEDLREQIQDLRERVLVSQFNQCRTRSLCPSKESYSMVATKVCRYGERHLHHRDVGGFQEGNQKAVLPRDVAYLARKNMRRLKHTGIEASRCQDLATVMAVAESLTDYMRGDSSKIESLEDSHAMGGGTSSKDHNAPKKGSGKTSNVQEGRNKAERKEFTPKIKCFLCDGPHWARDCPKRKRLVP
ncbi:hypothetical protein CK203_012816 [Vitis vinifera]|uniref:Uncharacterized protein n=1 Tax=Vitis vinifera TaxID=29760 RepID=A0A438JLX1_VITVI|nr:hypothetical protein CK203_012816 [Vitis vinifera]